MSYTREEILDRMYANVNRRHSYDRIIGRLPEGGARLAMEELRLLAEMSFADLKYCLKRADEIADAATPEGPPPR